MRITFTGQVVEIILFNEKSKNIWDTSHIIHGFSTEYILSPTFKFIKYQMVQLLQTENVIILKNDYRNIKFLKDVLSSFGPLSGLITIVEDTIIINLKSDKISRQINTNESIVEIYTINIQKILDKQCKNIIDKTK